MIYLFYNECELLKVENLPFYIKISIKKNYCTATICAASISGTVNESYSLSYVLLYLCFNNNKKIMSHGINHPKISHQKLV